jgi:LysR family tcuABC transcriptional regulator
MHDKVTLRQVMAFVAVCEEASFSRAAARERATQSGISQHIAALESTLGAKLVDRTCSGVHPTEIGFLKWKKIKSSSVHERADELSLTTL